MLIDYIKEIHDKFLSIYYFWSSSEKEKRSKSHGTFTQHEVKKIVLLVLSTVGEAAKKNLFEKYVTYTYMLQRARAIYISRTKFMKMCPNHYVKNIF